MATAGPTIRPSEAYPDRSAPDDQEAIDAAAVELLRATAWQIAKDSGYDRPEQAIDEAKRQLPKALRSPDPTRLSPKPWEL